MSEFIVNDYTVPKEITCNYDDLHANLSMLCANYKSVIYSKEQIKDAKKDRKDLKDIRQKIVDERNRQREKYMKPFNNFEEQCNNLIGIVDDAVDAVDTQIKSYQAQEKNEKQKEIEKTFDGLMTDYPDLTGVVTLDKIFDKKWLNKTEKIASVADEIKAKLDRINLDLAIVRRSFQKDSIEENQAIGKYFETYDVMAAIDAGEQVKKFVDEHAEQQVSVKETKTENKSVEKTGVQKVVLEIIASKDSFDAINNIIDQLMEYAEVNVISKEEI